jgi:hypothetical protein
MKIFAKLAALSLLTICSTSTMEAQAGNQYVDPTRLPNASKPYKAPLQIQVVNENPRITSTPMPEEGKRLMVIDVAPPAVAPTEVMYVRTGGNSGNGLPPGVVDLGALPQSRLGSNIPMSGPLSMRNKLPQGQNSNGLLHQAQHLQGRMNPPANTAKPASSMASPGLIRKTEMQQPLVYERPGSTGAGGASNSRTTTEVIGTLKRNSLLKKTGN